MGMVWLCGYAGSVWAQDASGNIDLTPAPCPREQVSFRDAGYCEDQDFLSRYAPDEFEKEKDIYLEVLQTIRENNTAHSTDVVNTGMRALREYRACLSLIIYNALSDCGGEYSQQNYMTQLNWGLHNMEQLTDVAEAGLNRETMGNVRRLRRSLVVETLNRINYMFDEEILTAFEELMASMVKLRNKINRLIETPA